MCIVPLPDGQSTLEETCSAAKKASCYLMMLCSLQQLISKTTRQNSFLYFRALAGADLPDRDQMLWPAAELLVRNTKLKETDTFSKTAFSVLPNYHLNQFPRRIFVSLYIVRL